MDDSSPRPPLIIEVALNGRTTPRENPSVPITPAEIARDAVACIRAGAAIVHQHDQALADGLGAAQMAIQSAATYRLIYEAIPDALCYPTIAGTEGRIGQGWGHNRQLAESGLVSMAFLDPGSLNYVDLDRDGLPRACDGRYSYTNADIRWMFEQCHELDLAPSIMALDGGFLRMVVAIAHAGQLPRGTFVKLAFGGMATAKQLGLPPSVPSLECLVAMLAGTSLPWAATVYGGDCVGTGMAEEAIRRGGHVRVGLEDYAGDRRPTNVELVEEVVVIARRYGRPIARPADAARILGVPAR